MHSRLNKCASHTIHLSQMLQWPEILRLNKNHDKSVVATNMKIRGTHGCLTGP